jgi:hypothetical protein
LMGTHCVRLPPLCTGVEEIVTRLDVHFRTDKPHRYSLESMLQIHSVER